LPLLAGSLKLLRWRFPYPTYGQLSRAVGKLPADARELLIHGSRHLFEQWGIVRRKESAAPNDLWHIDATQLCDVAKATAVIVDLILKARAKSLAFQRSDYCKQEGETRCSLRRVYDSQMLAPG
jgi:hypothetical protein